MASYWLGIACVVMTVSHLARACGPGDLANPGAGKWAGITYITFHPAAELILVLSIAAGLMSRWHSKTS